MPTRALCHRRVNQGKVQSTQVDRKRRGAALQQQQQWRREIGQPFRGTLAFSLYTATSDVVGLTITRLQEVTLASDGDFFYLHCWSRCCSPWSVAVCAYFLLLCLWFLAYIRVLFWISYTILYKTQYRGNQQLQSGLIAETPTCTTHDL
ncbi:uncharacterized protein BO97DRAFT_410765 [Aspergillus homomorphus CBS 101889]|uniref:Uncharacterized protein n=1 Tax=Aspergillus homomorphus (strain CBS 101889) TaxID=1450537 RepID=A0A395I9A8_ASPHC|nr:hypothetical protein BO97DRAFT_410765 [Aspergillus homomorphus CBS 101889]RAL16369.1 hypothetical protein BO97DRAFT_410765 [Aspergillus homomorphus CBS 101889]